MTDRELMQEALDALTYVGDKDIYSDTIDALRDRLATCDRCGKVNPAELHTCTPQRIWQGLTDDEVMVLNRRSYDAQIGLLPLTFYRAIEAKLKEKNT